MKENTSRSVLTDLGNGLDAIIAVLAALFLILGTVLIVQGVSVTQLLFSDISDLPWGDLWDLLQGLGLTTVAGRVIVGIFQRSRADRYAEAIWKVLDEVGSAGLSKPRIVDQVRLLMDERSSEKFQWKRFRKAWMDLRKAGEIKAIQDSDQGIVYILKIDS